LNQKGNIENETTKPHNEGVDKATAADPEAKLKEAGAEVEVA